MAEQLTRRAFLKGAAAGTAVGGLAALGADLGPRVARAQEIRIRNAKTFPSICPYCAVGCGTLIHTVGDQIINIEGNPESPVNYGNLCPKGAATYQLHINPNRLTKVLHRAPGAAAWEEVELEWAMDRVAELCRSTRDETFRDTIEVRDSNGEVMQKRVNASTGIFSLGGATMDNEWNYMQQKLLRGLGVVSIENQARI